MSPISSGTATAMTVTAVIIDILSIIPFVGMATDVIASMLFGIWFSHHGISLVAKRPLGFLGTIIGEFIPGIGALPFWTIFIIVTIRKENEGASS